MWNWATLTLLVLGVRGSITGLVLMLSKIKYSLLILEKRFAVRYNLQSLWCQNCVIDYHQKYLQFKVQSSKSLLLKSQSLSVYVCMSGYAFRHASIYGPETWHRGKADHSRLMGILSKWPHQRSEVIKRKNYFRNVLWLLNLVRKTPEKKEKHCWGQRSHRGQSGTTKGQFAFK